MKIALVISDMQIGGAQRVAAILANEWLRLRHSVDIITLDASDHPAFELDRAVHLRPLDCLARSGHPIIALFHNFSRILKLRKALKTSMPDVVIGFGEVESVLACLAASGLAVPVVCYFQTNPAHRTLNKIWRKISDAMLPRMAGIMVQTPRGMDILKANFPITSLFCLPNPVPMPENAIQQKKRPDDFFQMMSAGRFVSAKGFDLLIRALALADAHLPPWHLTIYGDGEDRELLEQLISDNNLQDKISLPGFSTAMDETYARHDLFILSSRREGFPNVLVEAMAHGCPVLACTCDTGPSDILTHQETGYLVPPLDPQALAEGIIAMAADKDKRQKMAVAALSIVRRFSPQSVAEDWIDYLVRIKADANPR